MKKRTSTTKHSVLLFWQHAWRYAVYVLGVAIAVPMTIFVYQFIPPLILANVLTRLAQGAFEPNEVWSSFGSSLVAYAALVIIGGAFMWRIVDWFVWRLESNVQQDMANRVFKHLLSQSAGFHANRFGGSLVSQTNKLLGAYIRVADTTVFQVVPLISSLALTSIILAPTAPLFVMLLLVFAVFYLIIAFYITRHVRDLSANQAAAESVQTGYLADSVTNVMTIKSFAASTHEYKQFNNLTDITKQRLGKVLRANQKQLISLTAITSSMSALALVMAVVSVVKFNANIATVFLIFSYTAIVVRQLWEFGNSSLRNYNRAFGDASEMTEILRIETEVKDPTTPEKPKINKGRITFKSVDFTHDGGGDALFRKLNLHIKAGEKVGLVGPSGSGKTTFTRLLLRFSDIDGGEILIDGQNIAHLTQDDLRRHIAYVPQEPLLFHRSLAENIAYGQPGASQDEITAIAKAAHAHEFIKKLPAGYDTLVGERGVKLSGGQRQRVAIARAMIKNAPILLLDEATSALDSESESLIQDALWHLMENRTAIVIAHRLSTIQKMDRIIVLDNGKIVEEGSHKQLVRSGGPYSELWSHQTGGFLDD